MTTGSAITLVVISLVIYGWQTAAAWFFSVRVAGRRLSAWGFRLPTRAYFWTIPAALAVVYVASIAHDVLVHPQTAGHRRRVPAHRRRRSRSSSSSR